MPRFSEKLLHLGFEVLLWLKALFALTEVCGGVAAYLVPHDALVRLAAAVTQNELARDPDDVVANYLLHAAQSLSLSTQHFAAWYLFAHGAVKLWLVAGLLRGKLWYYPVAIAVFGLFVAYQVYRFTGTHSLWLVVITVVDLIVIALTWHEYSYRRATRAQA